MFIMQAAQRDLNQNYLVPAWVSSSMMAINGIPVVVFDEIPAGTYLVADMTKFHIRDLEMTTIQVGWEMDDFTKNLVTILAEKRLASFVKSNDVEAFIYDTFTNGITFLEA